MSNLHLVTGYAGAAHITPEDHGSLYAAIFGSGSFVLDRGNKLAATMISNNKIRISDGDVVLQGRHIRLSDGYVDLTIENGSQGYWRNDLVVVRYTRNASSGVEEANLVVIKGAASTSTPVDPEYNDGDILNGHAVAADFPLYRVPLNGLTVGTPEQLFNVSYLVTLGSDKKVPAENLPSLDFIPTKEKGAKGGVAPLDEEGKIGSGYLPSMNYIPTSQKAAANGVAPLNSSKAVPVGNGGTGATNMRSACNNLQARFLGVPESVISQADLNDVKTPGVYKSSTLATKNTPPGWGGGGVFVVETWMCFPNYSVIKQTSRGGRTTISGSVTTHYLTEYVRYFTGSAWTEWKLTEEIEY